MFRSIPLHIRLWKYLIFALLALIIIWIVTWGDDRIAYALPEYAARTNESCATCHVNPGGGGPRTLRGLLWSARGKPDVMLQLPGFLIAPGVIDGGELYDIACAGCHGLQGEGLIAINLVGLGVSEISIRSFVVRGIPRSGMPPYGEQFTESQLDTLVTFVLAMENGQTTPQQAFFLLEPPQFQGIPFGMPKPAGGN